MGMATIFGAVLVLVALFWQGSLFLFTITIAMLKDAIVYDGDSLLLETMFAKSIILTGKRLLSRFWKTIKRHYETNAYESHMFLRGVFARGNPYCLSKLRTYHGYSCSSA